ncbi:unnamed protein product [Heligmosomoides polygyrus]|uniref:Integrase catalytic domain-containing protein n=1 Tax=Heligmosomoides polygyrus TaxID=6339 RepID=A0A183FZH8_HELPZ|nr:unnamed protein product [Heligmosomoides polygyrus]
MFSAECWPATKEVEMRFIVMETKMLRWTAGVTRTDRIRNDAIWQIRKKFGVAPIVDKLREALLRWYDHVLRGKKTASETKKGEKWVEVTQQSNLLEDEGLSEISESKFGAPDLAVIPLPQVLHELDDTAAVLGRDAKRLRDSTVDAISDVRVEAQSTSVRLAQKVREGNSSLLEGLNSSFKAVDDRIRMVPTVATLAPDGSAPRIPFFSGTTDGLQLSAWLRRFDDIARTRVVPLNSEQKTNLLIAYLEGVAREKIEELSEADRRSFDAVVNHLRSFFEGPHHRYMARQMLSSCRQEATEPSVIFANRLLGLVRAATAGQDPAVQKERVLEEFVAHLRPDIRSFVKLDNPASFEQAVNRAQTVEQLLAEATTDRLINPTVRAMADVSAFNTPRPGPNVRNTAGAMHRDANLRTPQRGSSASTAEDEVTWLGNAPPRLCNSDKSHQINPQALKSFYNFSLCSSRRLLKALLRVKMWQQISGLRKPTPKGIIWTLPSPIETPSTLRGVRSCSRDVVAERPSSSTQCHAQLGQRARIFDLGLQLHFGIAQSVLVGI